MYSLCMYVSQEPQEINQGVTSPGRLWVLVALPGSMSVSDNAQREYDPLATLSHPILFPCSAHLFETTSPVRDYQSSLRQGFKTAH